MPGISPIFPRSSFHHIYPSSLSFHLSVLFQVSVSPSLGLLLASTLSPSLYPSTSKHRRILESKKVTINDATNL